MICAHALFSVNVSEKCTLRGVSVKSILQMLQRELLLQEGEEGLDSRHEAVYDGRILLHIRFSLL